MLQQRITYLIIGILISLSVFSNNKKLELDPPQVNCIEVLEDGGVTVYWRSLDQTVKQFIIYYSTNGTDWHMAGTVDVQNLDNQYTVSNQYINANEQVIYFKIEAIYPSLTVDSEIYNTMFLVADNTTLGTATLLWNSLGLTPPPGSDDFYRIYISIYENGIQTTWDLLADDVTNTLFNFIIPNGICLDSLNFKVEVVNSFGCKSVSNISGNWFSETIQPEKPVFDSVSIINDEFAILGWTPSVSEDVLGTVIYRYESGIWIEIDTVPNNLPSIYVDSSYLACGTNNEYAIAAIDSCAISSPGTYQSPLRPILLNSLSYEICAGSITINWESYLNADPGLEKYEIWVSSDGGTDTLIDEVPGTQLTYSHIGVSFSTNYTYFIRAIFGDKSSTSCRKSIKTGSYIAPGRLYLANSSVLIDNTIELTIDIDLDPMYCSWEIFRTDPGGGNFNKISSFQRSEVNSSPYSFIDENVDPNIGFYQYYVDVYDSCGLKSIQSNTQKTIFLSDTTASEDIIDLSWNFFEGWDAGVNQYYIFRFINEEYPGEKIDSVDSGINQYTDDISSLSKSISSFGYYVVANENPDNPLGYKEISYSNIVSHYRETEFFMPNAFRPSGNNSTFKPVSTGFAGSNYLLQIYNRWGQLIFETNDYNEGWNGYSGERRSPQGTYIYRVTYNSVFNKPVVKEGTVTLID